MGAVPNTLRKAGVYYFRRAVPKDLARILARRELCRSLKTTDARVANGRSRHLYLFSEEMFAVARSTPMLTDADISRLVQDFYATELAEENAIRLNSRVVFDEANRQAILAYYDGVGAQSRDALARNDLEVVTSFTDGLLERHGLAEHVEPMPETPLLRIMKACVLMLRRHARAQETQRRLDELRFLLADVSEVPLSSLPWSQVRIDRTNRRWETLYQLANLFLKREWQRTNHDAKAGQGITLLFAMNDLFEAYIAALARRALRDSDLTVQTQGGLRY